MRSNEPTTQQTIVMINAVWLLDLCGAGAADEEVAGGGVGVEVGEASAFAELMIPTAVLAAPMKMLRGLGVGSTASATAPESLARANTAERSN